MFDFSKALAQSKKMESSDKLLLLALGQQGAGKSYLAGTLGVKTLYMYFSGESHGSPSAQIQGGDNIQPYCLDRYDGKQLNADDAFKHLLYILNNADLIKSNQYKLLVLDSASELESVIRETREFDKRTTNDKGKHDGFMEKGATCDMLKQVLNAAKTLQRDLDIHFMMTAILDVRSVGEYGEIQEAAPRIRGAGVAEFLCLQFDDVVAVGRMTKDGVTKHKLQYGVNISKVAKEVSGSIKMMNYNPRIKGVGTDKLPPYMPADLKLVHALKRGEYEPE